jgi:hypothetical protein
MSTYTLVQNPSQKFKITDLIRGQGQGLGSSYPDRGWVWVGVSSGEGYW